jgi:UDP-GlcNAc3NAcA epimerase
MIKLLTIIGARPQIIKAAALSRAIKNKFSAELEEVIVHTGQHYDDNMSQVFFDELDIPHPNYNLNAGSGSHGRQTAAMIDGIEEVLLREKPDAIILYGDTNSTLAGAIAASKLNVPVVHIEAGLRSFNKSMPEEINRIMCDHVSTLLFSPTKAGFRNLQKEGFRRKPVPPFNLNNPKIYHCGDVMYDNTLYFSSLAEQKTNVLQKNGLEAGEYVLATIHRNNNTDDEQRLNAIFSAIHTIASKYNTRFVVPLHPRTAKLLPGNLSPEIYSKVKTDPLIRIIDPVSFLEMIALEKNARLIMTDSGGVQKEAYFFKKPCIILRPETEWIELVSSGSAMVTDANEPEIIKAFGKFLKAKRLKFPDLFGDGTAAEFICTEIIKNIQSA